MENGLYHKTTLANGLRVLTAPMPHTRSVAVSVYVGAGSRYETEQEAGLSHFVEHLCFKGTERRPTSREISEAIDGAGGGGDSGSIVGSPALLKRARTARKSSRETARSRFASKKSQKLR